MNQILKNIQNQVVNPAIRNIKTSALAYVVEVNDLDKTCNVIIMENDGRKVRKNNLSYDTGRGLQMNHPKPGDTVEIGYRNNNFNHSYIIRIHEEQPTSSESSLGQDLPNYTTLF